MENNLLTLENAIFSFDQFKYVDEIKPLAFSAERNNKDGILLVTDIRFSFYYLSDSDEIKFEHILFNLINSITLEIYDDKKVFNINYAYSQEKIKINSTTDIEKIKSFIEKYLPDKLKTKKITEKEMNSFYNENNLENINTSEDKSNINLKKDLKKPLSFFINASIFLVLCFIAFSYSINKKTTSKTNGIINQISNATYFIKKQEVEKEIFQFAYKVRKNDEEIKDFTAFLKANFSSVFDREVGKDPWDNYYQLEYLDNNKFRIISYGPDKIKNTSDDISKEFTKINKNED